MPRASSSQSQLQPNSLGRNQKCDATLPCTPCTRSHAHAVKLYPHTAPPQPECTYDNPEDIAEGPRGKICRLEAHIAELKATIQEKDAVIRDKDTLLAGCVCRIPGIIPLPLDALMTNATPLDSHATIRNDDSASASPLLPDSVLGPTTNLSSLDIFNQTQIPDRISPPIPPPTEWKEIPTALPSVPEPPILSTATDDAMGSSIASDIWPLNIPPPELLHHLVETVFNSVPLASRTIHRPSFMASLSNLPSSPEFPHVSLLHAFCALASLYTPVILDMNPVDLNEDLYEGAAASLAGGVVNRGFHVAGKRYFPRRLEDIHAEDEYDFASSHARWCLAGYMAAMQRGDSLVQQAQGLHQSPGFGPLSRIPAALHFTIPPAQTPIESETRRNLFWVIYTLERVMNVSNVWPLVHSDEDCSQMMPCRLKDFEAGQFIPTQGRQRIFSNKMLVTHPRLTTDAFTLYIKASILLGRVKVFNGRFKYRYTDGDWSGRPVVTPVSSPSSSSSSGGPNACAYGRTVREVTRINPKDTDEFVALDELIQAFIESIPREFKDPVGLETGAKLDPTLYMAHMMPHMAMIALHDPHANVFSMHDASAEKLLKSARAILDLIYKVCSTTFDLIYLDHASSTAWFVTGVTLIRFLNARTVQEDEAEITKLTQELGVVKFMLGNLGERTAVGFRQIKLLEMVYKMEMGSYTPNGYQSTISYSAINEVSP
ncbi:hypothetical protein FRB95_007403 [Tulasnella sp. JGI-2019a]|nr:hypothetical protein FRB95_007403 [Tulasnella sp. JGI-2019a]